MNGITASLTAIGASARQVAAVALGGQHARRRAASAIVSPSITRAAALASGTAVALETNGTVRDGARVGLEDVEHVGAERVLDVEQAAHADARGRSPRWPRGSARISASPSVIGGSAHDESPEWMPASSMCSITPPRKSSLAVVERVDVDLDRVVEEPVDQHRVLGADLGGALDVALAARSSS